MVAQRAPLHPAAPAGCKAESPRIRGTRARTAHSPSRIESPTEVRTNEPRSDHWPHRLFSESMVRVSARFLPNSKPKQSSS